MYLQLVGLRNVVCTTIVHNVKYIYLLNTEQNIVKNVSCTH